MCWSAGARNALLARLGCASRLSTLYAVIVTLSCISAVRLQEPVSKWAFVTPAKAGAHANERVMDFRFRGNDIVQLFPQ